MTEEGGHCREVADVERLKKERMYGLSAKKKDVVARWPLVEVRLQVQCTCMIDNTEIYEVTLRRTCTSHLSETVATAHPCGGFSSHTTWILSRLTINRICFHQTVEYRFDKGELLPFTILETRNNGLS